MWDSTDYAGAEGEAQSKDGRFEAEIVITLAIFVLVLTKKSPA
jgi:hypothetical protein